LIFKKIFIQKILDTLKINCRLIYIKEIQEYLKYFQSWLIYKLEVAVDHYNDPDPWTQWYWFLRSRRLFIIKVWLLLFGVIFFFILVWSF